MSEHDELKAQLSYEGNKVYGAPHVNQLLCDGADAIEALTEEKERLQGYVSDWRDKCVVLRKEVCALGVQRDEAEGEVKALTAENERLRAAVEAIKQATIEGKVCDDVAWFSTIETLHDYCARTLEWSPDQLSLSHQQGVKDDD